MALKTQGFALSALPRSPSIPANAGAVDVKEIYDGVRQGLAAFENVRRAPASMLLADAEMAAKTAEAPLGTRQVLAQTEGIEQQTPLKTAILASEASPAMLEAKRQALLNKSTKQPAGDVQLAMSLAAARQRLAEDPTDVHAAQLVAALEPIALSKSAVSAKNPQGAIDAGIQKTADTNQTRVDIATDANTSREKIAADRIESVKQIGRESRTLQEVLAKLNVQKAIDVANIGAKGRVDAAGRTLTNKTYETAAQKNEKVREEMAALSILNDKAEDYMASGLGSGVFVGSGPMVALRSLLGDDTGKNFVAATSQSMRSAVETMRGLGAMSEKEFAAAMSQLPTTNEPEDSIRLKLDYLNAIRPTILARSNLFLEELENGKSPMMAHQAVRKAFPIVDVKGNIIDPVNAQTSTTQGSATAPTATAGTAFATPADAQAAADAGAIKSGDKITVGGVPGTWK